LKEANTIYKQKPVKEVAKKFGKGYVRKNRMNCLTFTIDSAGTRTIDDAITVEKIDEHTLKVGVHISDPTDVVKIGSQMGKEAQLRVENKYIGKGKNFMKPMLPREIAADLCSLKPDQERRAITVWFYINDEGLIILDHKNFKPKYERTWIKS